MNGDSSNGAPSGMASDRGVVDDRPRQTEGFSERGHSAADSWNSLFQDCQGTGGDFPPSADGSSLWRDAGDSKYDSASERPPVSSDHTFPAQDTVTLLNTLEADLQAQLDNKAEPAGDKGGKDQDAAGSSPETPPDPGDDPAKGQKDTADPGQDRSSPSPPNGSRPSDSSKRPKKISEVQDWGPPDFKKFFDRHPGGGGGKPASEEHGPTPIEHWLKEIKERRENFDAAIAWNQACFRRAKLEAPGVVGDLSREEEKRRHPAG